MKILFVAVYKPTSTNVWQANAFEELGHQVIRYDYREECDRLGTTQRDQDIIRVCNKEKPNLVLFSKCNTVDIRVVRECNRKSTTILWFMDHIHKVDKELIDKVQSCNFVFCSIDPISAKKYNKRVQRLQGGYDPKQHFPINMVKDIEISFIGSIHKRTDCHLDRYEYHEQIGFNVFTKQYGKQHSVIVSRSKINLNFTEGLGTSNRLYKLMASKGFVMTQPWKVINEDFEVGKDLVTFSSISELKEKVGYYLKHENERNQIAENGHNTVKKYDNLNFAKKILEVV